MTEQPGADADDIARWVLGLRTSPAAGGVAIAQADAPAPVDAPATPAAALAAARLKGRLAGAKAERERISAILSTEEAKTRPRLALHIALNTDYTPEEAERTLVIAGREADEKLGARMRLVPSPAVRPDCQQRSDAPQRKTP